MTFLNTLYYIISHLVILKLTMPAGRGSDQEAVKTAVHHATTLEVEGQRPPAEVCSSLLFGTLGSVLRGG